MEIKQVEIFAQEMEKQLRFNQEHKSDWREFKNVKEILVELEYHKAKMLLALKERNSGALREYIADCANILMFLGNSFDLYDEFKDDDITYELKIGLFNELKTKDIQIKTGMKNL